MSTLTSYLGLPSFGSFVSKEEEKHQGEMDPKASPPDKVDNSKIIQGVDSAEVGGDAHARTCLC